MAFFRHKTQHRFDYTRLLIFLVSFLLVLPIVADLSHDQNTPWITLFYLVSFCVLAWRPMASGNQLTKIYLIIAVFGTTSVGLGYVFGLQMFEVFILIGQLVFAVATIAAIGKSVISSQDISLNNIMGSVCLYLLFGLAFSVINNLLFLIDSDAFVNISDNTNDYAFLNFLYYSFVTMSTLGYGDILPVTYSARAISIFSSIFGQFYIAIIVAGLVAGYLNANASKRHGNKTQR